MSLEGYRTLLQVVPDVPELLIDNCSETSAKTRDDIMMKLRISMLVPLCRRQQDYPSLFLPPRAQLFTAIHTPPADAVLLVTPQQVQYITQLAEFVQKHPVAVINAARHLLRQRQYSDLTFLAYSSIPAFFGFFASAEHFASAFPFYCSLVGAADRELVLRVMTPFYCCACTYRFIEMVFDTFAPVFCHDLRLEKDAIQSKVLSESEKPLITAIRDAFPLLPHPHQFLLRFMLTRGWDRVQVLEFFLNEFAFPQLLRYMKATAFPSHFVQLRALVRAMTSRTSMYLSLLETFDNSPSFFEIPQAFTVFDVPFTQLLLTPTDIHVMLSSLKQVNEVSSAIQPFLDAHYFDTIEFKPLWVRVYFRGPKPVETSYNWRNVVFTLNETVVPKNKDFERMWRELCKRSHSLDHDPIEFLRGESLRYAEFTAYKHLKGSLGQRYEAFLEYAILQNTHALQVRSQIFERYLVDSMSLRSLRSWESLIDAYYSKLVIPTALETVDALMQGRPKALNLSDSLISVIPLPNVHQLCFMSVVRHLLPNLPPECAAKFTSLDARWRAHMQTIRETLPPPTIFEPGRPNSRAQALLTQKLWTGITRLKCFDQVRFEWALDVVLDALGSLDELTHSDDLDSRVIQGAVAFSECSNLLSRFMLVNVFAMKHKAFRSISTTTSNFLLWIRFEYAVLKLLERDTALMASYTRLQDEAVIYRPVVKSRATPVSDLLRHPRPQEAWAVSLKRPS
jgi:hypothetical protein